MNERDDIFDDNLAEVEEKAIFSRTWTRIHEPLQQEGFREGVSAGREESFQKGFDEGYLNGFKEGFSLGYFNGILKALQDQKTNILPDVNTDKMYPFENPTRGLCILCTHSGKMLSAEKIKLKLAENINIPLDEIASKQKIIVAKAVDEKLIPDYLVTLNNLGIDMN
ncbi:uncharacterized protein LOC142325126 [Lycorma delicatula]|uniref:uncharacterized protein LOC142325126 n=1 Tax=Lycorma delicatula TaxID=130591 RepID=UPI003F519F3C